MNIYFYQRTLGKLSLRHKLLTWGKLRFRQAGNARGYQLLVWVLLPSLISRTALGVLLYMGYIGMCGPKGTCNGVSFES